MALNKKKAKHPVSGKSECLTYNPESSKNTQQLILPAHCLSVNELSKIRRRFNDKIKQKESKSNHPIL